LQLLSSMPTPGTSEVRTNLQPVNSVGNLAILARLLDPWTEIGVSQRDVVFVAARGIGYLPGRDRTVGIDPRCAAADRVRLTGLVICSQSPFRLCG